MIELQFFPTDKGDNEYLPLFNEALAAYGVRSRDGLPIGTRALREADPPLDIVQFHWTPEFIWRNAGPGAHHRIKGVLRLWKYLDLARRMGVRVVWTVHDFEHHEGSGPIDHLGYWIIARHADLVICHDAPTRDRVRHRYRLRPEVVVVMPHGNYDGVFPTPRPRSETLEGLGLSPWKRTLVSFGAIRPYKRLDRLIDAFRLLDDSYQLIIFGQPIEAGWGDDLREQAAGLDGVRLILERVDSQRMADLIHAGDCVVMPYRRITTSGALNASLTLGRGVVAADLPFFRGMLANDPEAGVLCDPADVSALAGAIEEFFTIPADRRHAAARRIADGLAWHEVIRPVGDWLIRNFPDRIAPMADLATRHPGAFRRSSEVAGGA